ncbi:unnamed protein product [Schistosoma mattheei]|uniref:Uncharacterized protein n=1 Tax=Schistosoma mattheei TaxID=31246 RepID=A0A3P8K1H4_9TREM|nr:unnamed protein product [Schistosoma mattheei]
MLSNRTLDLPPAYTDVVKLSAIETESNNNNNNNNNSAIPDAFRFNLSLNEQITNPSFLSKSSSNQTGRFNSTLYTSEQNATSSQILNVKSSNTTPPPPSYEEIILPEICCNSVNDITLYHKLLHVNEIIAKG